MTRTSRANKISIHLRTDELHAVNRYALQLGVSRGRATKFLFTRGLTSLTEGNPVLEALEQLGKDIESREWEQIGLLVESVISLRYLADISKPGMSLKLREFTKEAVANIKEKVHRNNRIF